MTTGHGLYGATRRYPADGGEAYPTFQKAAAESFTG